MSEDAARAFNLTVVEKPIACRFCGSDAEIVSLGEQESPVGIGCSKCPVILAEYGEYKRFDTEADAVKEWNSIGGDRPFYSLDFSESFETKIELLPYQVDLITTLSDLRSNSPSWKPTRVDRIRKKIDAIRARFGGKPSNHRHRGTNVTMVILDEVEPEE